MVTKAIIEEIVDEYRVKVRIPIFNQIRSVATATPTSELSVATICGLPNSLMNYQINDIVYVAFEDNLLGKPVIVGQLNRSTKTTQNSSLTADSLNVKIDSYLPEYTYIGEVTPENIKYLQGTNDNIQSQFEILSKRIAKLEESINKLKGK